VAPPSSEIEVEWQFDAIDLRPVERWIAALTGPASGPGTHLRDGPGQQDVISRAPGVGPSPLRDGIGLERPGLPTSATGGLVASPKPTKRLVDTYLDTEDWRVCRSGYVLRLRRAGTSSEMTLKDTAPATSGLRKRVEITQALPDEAGPQDLDGEGSVGRRIRALAGARALQSVIEVRTTRRPFDLKIGDQPVAEIALDDTVISPGDGQRPIRLRRVEVEVVPSRAQMLEPVVDRLRTSCGLQPATLSKFEAGLLAAGLEVPGPPDLGATQLPSTPSIGDVAYVVLRRNLAAMLAHEPGTRLGEDPEELHDMRVATRRMRAALSLFSDALPVRARHVRDELGWLGRTLGSVRDLDVQLERLDQWARELPEEDKEALDELAGLLEHERETARAELLSALESSRYERLVSSFTTMLRQGPPRRSAAARAPAVAVVPDLVQARHRSATKVAKRAQRSRAADDLHLLRIRCKRLRYALEFVSEIYDGDTSKMVRRVVRLQDSLGLMQDARVAAERLHELATKDTGDLSRSTVFVMGGVAERYRQDAERVSRSVPGHLKDLSGSSWQKLKMLMERKRFEFGSLYGWPVQSRPAQAASPSPPERTDRAPGAPPDTGAAEPRTDSRADPGVDRPTEPGLGHTLTPSNGDSSTPRP